VHGVCEGGTSLESCPPCFTMRQEDTDRNKTTADWLAKRAEFVNAVFGDDANGMLPNRSQPDVGPIKIQGPQVHQSNCARYGFCDAQDSAYGTTRGKTLHF
jgi:hypothetical protein